MRRLQGSPLAVDREHVLFGLSCLVGLWLAAAMPVFSEEAYYWAYAQHPDLSYFDHPPMVAWTIWLGTRVFGNGALGLRFATWLFTCGTIWLGVLMLQELRASERARAAWISIGLGVPFLLALRFFTTPDVPLLFFWSATIWSLRRARDGRVGWWVISGGCAGLALLSKYSALFLAVGGILLLISEPRLRAQRWRRGPWLALGCAGLAFSPVIVWNAMHHFESFAFQTGGRFGKADLGTRWFVTCVLGQCAIVHPLLWPLLIAVVAWVLRAARRKDERARWLLAFGLPLPLFFFTAALWIQVKINWFSPAYLVLLLGAVLWWSESGFPERHPRWARTVEAIVWTSAALAMCAPLVRLVPQRSGTTWYGWDHVASRARHWKEELGTAGSRSTAVFYAAADHNDAAQLWRELYLIDESALAPLLSENVFGRPALQFDHWSAPLEHLGQHAIFVLARPETREDYPLQLRRVFASAEPVERVGVEFLGIEVLTADIWVCRNYLGPRVASHPDQE